MNNKLTAPLVVLIFMLCSTAAHSNTFSVDTLLNQIETGEFNDNENHKQRLETFLKQNADRQLLLQEISDREIKQNALSDQQEQRYDDNENELARLQSRLDDRLGNLKELFGVLQQISSDANSQFYGSATQIHYPERSEFLTDFTAKMGQTTELPKIEEIEHLWFELQREMTALGQVKRLKRRY